ncbi:helix-turn-helix domain-containing protein [Ruminiclostridium cellulolyticum]|uniref:Transcriptional regulator, XRE family n=1 Tax=Ruminiclostridium cellulolyticum (strain ATCC 35319 / DSM 5812 / JCM 6584 / H10) TaxID=394503 RepID=B8I150_RUMCH|nr:XRE family transcriptional regulator [Ruminiclostridium cellulolyticum]ACL77606.1 transcriptional regulator, XRE family [Ruminiclostridium cellulolyticum H10]
MTLGENIRELRKKKGLTIEALADELNSSYSTIGMYELDKRKPDYDMLCKFAEYFNVTVDYLLGVKKKSILSASDLYKEFIEQKVPIEKLADNIGISADTLFKILKSEEGATEADYYRLCKWLGYSEEKAEEFYLRNSPLTNKSFRFTQNLDFIPVPVLGLIRAGQPAFAEENNEGYYPTDRQFISDDHEYFYLRIKGDSMDKEFKEGSLVLVQIQSTLESGEIGVVLINGFDATVKKVFIRDNLITLMPQSNNEDHQPQTYDTVKEEIKILGKVVLAVKKY